MLWWIPITVAGMAALGVLTVVASTAAGRYEGQHVLTDPQEEWDAYVAEQGRGSMVLAEEEALYPLPWPRLEGDWLPAPPRLDPLPAPTVDPAPWLEQTRAELSPEALEALPVLELPEGAPPEIVLPDAGGWISGPCLDDPGPGVPPSSLTVAPGPVTDQPSRWLAEQLEIQRAWWAWQMEKARIFA